MRYHDRWGDNRHCNVTFGDVQAAHAAIKGAIVRTPAVPSPQLSAMTGGHVTVKYETMQATGSFKERGALNKLLSLGETERGRGVIAISAGNHGQALAYHAKRLGISATVVMPETAPFIKVANTEAYGARVVLSGETIAEARLAADQLIAAEGLTLIHPFDDPLVIAGQGTAGLEFVQDCPGLECLIIPVGGGGLIAGVAMAARALNPDIEIIGVEVQSFPSVHAALQNKNAVCAGATLADGIAVPGVSMHTLLVIRELVSDVVLVSENEVEAAMFTFATAQKTIDEGASAAALAALFADKPRFAGRAVGLIQCGGNVDPRVLASILMRGLERDNKIVSLRISVPDRPGILGEISSELGRCGVNILEVEHRRLYLDVPAKGAVVDIVIECKDRAHVDEAVAHLRGHGLEVHRTSLFSHETGG